MWLLPVEPSLMAGGHETPVSSCERDAIVNVESSRPRISGSSSDLAMNDGPFAALPCWSERGGLGKRYAGRYTFTQGGTSTAKHDVYPQRSPLPVRRERKHQMSSTHNVSLELHSREGKERSWIVSARASAYEREQATALYGAQTPAGGTRRARVDRGDSRLSRSRSVPHACRAP
ncbi:hypothetical protein IE81DRAFT_69643 [Ceraceosorus guamensis]|uniref:Uncharacterized protein n=1 Tax=Ceraceosorus guamensis TaxID=1522189 RepID=A0A316VR25_9BASI|nr:hypothetical protein IE81DRAFT_69643 [Ceraceosorus guamensis]PWN38853.1 hypothetical protein IE81DRAFT_69643 [Ceraceosorus guamensis]